MDFESMAVFRNSPVPVTVSEVREAANRLGICPRRSLGQHFLTDRNILAIIISAARLTRKDRVLEIGAGMGALTAALLEKAGRVVALEKDARLADFLAESFSRHRRLELRRADATELDYAALFGSGITKVVSNLPYSVASFLLAEMGQAPNAPALMAVTVQLEVAERLAAHPGTKAYGKLSVWMQMDYDVELVWRVSPTCFWPAPEVESAVVRLERRPDELSEAERDAARRLATAAFQHRRKQIGAIFAKTEWIGPERGTRLCEAAGIQPHARPEEIDRGGWLRLGRALEGAGGGAGRC